MARDASAARSFPSSVNRALCLLAEAGYEAYPVGGCVRDLLLGKTPLDWDITTNAEPAAMQETFRDHKCIETGLAHGTLTVLIDGQPLEITTFRVDQGYSDGRHPDRVLFSSSLTEDLARRDLTVNAMALSRDGRLIDPFGGREDLENGILRTVGEPAHRFREDGLRILRALRFASVLERPETPLTALSAECGKEDPSPSFGPGSAHRAAAAADPGSRAFTIEKNTEAALFRCRALLQGLSAERIKQEMDKLLLGRNVRQVLLKYGDIIGAALPELAPMLRFDQQNYHHCYDLWTHSVIAVAETPAVLNLRWAALLHDCGKPAVQSFDEKGVAHYYAHAQSSKALAEAALKRLHFSAADSDEILFYVNYHDLHLSPLHPTLRRYVGRFGPDRMRNLIQLKKADNLAQSPEWQGRQKDYRELGARLDALLAEESCFTLKDLALNGRDLLALGLSGPAVGDALNSALQAVFDEKVPNEKEALLRYLREQGPLEQL